MSSMPGASSYIWNWRATSNRRVTPFILAAIHITDNAQLPSATQEAVYSNRVGTGASFTFCVNRNGTFVQCLHPEHQVPWTNGSWLYPNYNLANVRRAVSQGYGANDATFLTIENVGAEPTYYITPQQVETCARIVAWGSRISGIRPSRETVFAHRYYDSVNRLYCPTRYDVVALLDRIINRANQILTGGALPNTATPSLLTSEDIVDMAILKNIVRNTVKKVTVRSGASLYRGPGRKYGFWDSRVEGILQAELIGGSAGELYRGSSQWWALRTEKDSARGIYFAHKSDVTFE